MSSNQCVKTRESGGFSLLELLVVLAILGLLAGLVGPQVMKHLGRAKSQTAGLQLSEFATALDSFYLDLGRYPASEEGLVALVQVPDRGLPGWNGPYLKKRTLPNDPWGNPYIYISPGADAAFDLLTYGADGTAGGTGDNADLRYGD